MQNKFTSSWRKIIDFARDLLVFIKVLEWLSKLATVFRVVLVVLFNRHFWIGLYCLLIMNTNPSATHLSAYDKQQSLIRITS